MDLIERLKGEPDNLLPCDGTVLYYGPVMEPQRADSYFHVLQETIDWQHDRAVIMGKEITTKRKVAWYADKPFDYRYSGVTKVALPWTRELRELKQLVEDNCGEVFNSCLLNLYHSGEEGMAWHSDAEKALKKDGAIGSLSLGAERNFSFRHKKTKNRVSRLLQHGSLLVMKDTTQTHWLHRLPPSKTVQRPRINLTFRLIVE
ncbi:alpha-ketoglutarate-dependent dioxygenase AlkB family protein [Emcibacter sp.]|uniref:alpha-ketoglutarate-dependent dioxygenase AlkB family protein n=1 Tax=Emcibacter sp. TaxID=1979954 RepID=UPI003A9590F2